MVAMALVSRPFTGQIQMAARSTGPSGTWPSTPSTAAGAAGQRRLARLSPASRGRGLVRGRGGGGQVAEPRVAAGRHQVVVKDAGDVVSRLHDLAFLDPDDPVAGLVDLAQLVRHQEHGARLGAQLVDTVMALALELGVPGSQGLVHEQDVVALRGRDGE